MRGAIIRWFCLSLLALGLAGCGFHMRGDLNLPPEQRKVKLVGDNKSDLYRMVAIRMKRVGVQLVDGDEQVPVVTLGNISVTNQVVSVDSRSQAVEYNMQFNTQYSLTLPNKPAQKFTASFSRGFLNKSSEALASSREQEQRTNEMIEQTADLILIQLSRVKY